MIKNFLKKLFKKKHLKKKLSKYIQIKYTLTRNTNWFSVSDTTTKNKLTTQQGLFLLNINQKKHNTKNNMSIKKTLNMFSIGSVIKYFNLKQGKSIRRNQKGLKIFLNFLKNVFLKKYQYDNMRYVFTINGFNYNLLLLKNFLFKLIQNQKYKIKPYVLFKIGVPYTTVKTPKKKSIKKKINKNIVSTFLKNNKQINF